MDIFEYATGRREVRGIISRIWLYKFKKLKFSSTPTKTPHIDPRMALIFPRCHILYILSFEPNHKSNNNITFWYVYLFLALQKKKKKKDQLLKIFLKSLTTSIIMISNVQ